MAVMLHTQYGGAGLDPAVTRLRETLWGGSNQLPEEVVRMMTDAGFESVGVVPSQDRGTAAMSAMILGCRPM